MLPRQLLILLLACPTAVPQQSGGPPANARSALPVSPAAAFASSSSTAVEDDVARAVALARAVRTIAARGPLWPGFDPRTVPLAVYDGEQTWLFRHPAPPEGFELVPDIEPAAHVWAGRHPALTANSSIDIGGVTTGTVLLDQVEGGRPLADIAALAIHEAFHVHQSGHAGWGANEADLFTYPVGEPLLLALRRTETEALRRALLAQSNELAACWAFVALDARSRRFERLSREHVDYERGTELNEGLATYVEHHAAGRAALRLPEAGYPADAVRARGYQTGLALALLLDRFDASWTERFEEHDGLLLDVELTVAMTPQAVCGFNADEHAAFERGAQESVADLVRVRRERRQEFERAPGWRLVVRAPAEPLWPQGFDPLNVHAQGNTLLHTRYLELGNGTGSLRLLGGKALTEQAGPHPLFGGVKRVTFTGLSALPVRSDEGSVVLDTPVLSGTFRGAHVKVDDEAKSVVVVLGKS